MKSILLFCILSFCFQYGMAQTKLIAHKRHSGRNFNYALASSPDDIANANFGMHISPSVKNAQLDTLIYIDKERAVMITSEYCSEQFSVKQDDKSLWKAGRDTVYNHPLFSQRHNLESIKKTLKEEYHFKNEIDKVVFIGYDNKKTKKRKSIFSFFSFFNIENNDSNGNGLTPYWLGIGLSFALSLLAYLLYAERTKRLSNT